MAGNALTKPRCSTVDKIEEIADWLGAKIPERIVREKIAERWGIGYRQIAYLLSHARLTLQKRSGKPRQVHQCDSFNYYLALQTHTSDPAIGLRCQENIDRLFGLGAQFTGGPLAPADQSTTVNVTIINVTGLTVDQIEDRIEKGEYLDPATIEHLPRGDRLRILRKAALALEPKETPT